MPEGRDEPETTAHAEHEARLAHAYFDTLVRMGTAERVAAQLTAAWVIARVRRDRDDIPEWER